MSKKRRKIVRPQYTARSVRIKQAPKKPVPKELKVGIGFCVFALILAVILFFALYNDGSLPVQDGNVVTEGDNWLVANTGTSSSPKYYKVGEVNPIDGYAVDPNGLGSSDPNMYMHTYTAIDSEAAIDGYYVRAIKQAPEINAESAYANYPLFGNNVVGEMQTLTIAGHEAICFTADVPDTALSDAAGGDAEAETSTSLTQQLLCYLPSVRDTSVLVVLYTDIDTTSEAQVDETVLYDMLQKVVANITFVEK